MRIDSGASAATAGAVRRGLALRFTVGAATLRFTGGAVTLCFAGGFGALGGFGGFGGFDLTASERTESHNGVTEATETNGGAWAN